MKTCCSMLMAFTLAFFCSLPRLASQAPKQATQAQAPETAPGEMEWRFTLARNKTANSTISAENICRGRHEFHLDPVNLPFMEFLAPVDFSVSPRQTHTVPVRFDTTGLSPGLYQGRVNILCASCRREPGCKQDISILNVFMTVPGGPTTWSNVQPAQKPPAARSPLLKWSDIDLTRKR